MSTTLDGWVTCTQLKITSVYMVKSYQEGEGMLTFNRLPKEKQSEIAQTIKGEKQKVA